MSKYREIQTIEEAETFFGKTARKKGGTVIFTVNNAWLSEDDRLFVNSYTIIIKEDAWSLAKR